MRGRYSLIYNFRRVRSAWIAVFRSGRTVDTARDWVVMPTGERREDIFIARFLSAYEDRSWADADIDWVDKRIDNAVEAVATRRSDGRKLAIEHTIIEPFLDDKKDFSFFSKAFLNIEQDLSLRVPDLWIRVFVGVGTLNGQRKQAGREVIVQTVHEWIRHKRHTLPVGFSTHSLRIDSIPGSAPRDVLLTTEVVSLAGTGKLHMRRQQIDVNLGKVIEKALKKKVPKLASTEADKRILLLERQHMNLHPNQILDQVEKHRPKFPELQCLDEIWILETIAYESDSYLRFERYENGNQVENLDFLGAEIFGC
jgi:hypothetical protein